MTSFVASLRRVAELPAVRALYYALILIGIALLAATQATATPGFIYQNF